MEAYENINIKLKEFYKLGGASKQLSKRKINTKLARRCHIAMASIVNEIWPQKEDVFKIKPELREFFGAMIKLHKDCENGYTEKYINEK
jgi:hypothetical protein